MGEGATNLFGKVSYATRNIVVRETDCGTVKGIRIARSLILSMFAERVFGRVSVDPIVDPITKETLVPAEGVIFRKIAQRIDEARIDSVLVRSPLTCETRGGVCSRCYGVDSSRGGSLVDEGEPVGTVASHAIKAAWEGRMVRRKGMLWGNVFKPGERESLKKLGFFRSLYKGRVVFEGGLTAVPKKDGTLFVTSPGTVTVKPLVPRIIVASLPVSEQTKLYACDGQVVEENELIAEWDPRIIVFFSRQAGRVKFEDIIEGSTAKMVFVEPLKGSFLVVTEDPREPRLRPRIVVRPPGASPIEGGEIIPLRPDMILMVEDGQEVDLGDRLAGISWGWGPPDALVRYRRLYPRQDTLELLDEFFEARRPQHYAHMADADGTIRYLKGTAEAWRLALETVEGAVKEYMIPLGSHIKVGDGESVLAGSLLTRGLPDPDEVLRVIGPTTAKQHLLTEIKELLEAEGAFIHDKHIEVLIRLMSQWVRVIDAGDTDLKPGDVVEGWVFRDAIDSLSSLDQRPPSADPVLVGISEAGELDMGGRKRSRE